MPSIFLLTDLLPCASISLPKALRGRRPRKKARKEAEAQDVVASKVVTTMEEEKPIATVLSGNLTDSTESMYSHSSSESTTNMEPPLPFLKSARFVSNDQLAESIEVNLPAESFYFMPMEEEHSDLQSVNTDASWGYFVDMEE
jgi:hypothetical protein